MTRSESCAYQRPIDFHEFWADTESELQGIPLTLSVVRDEMYSRANASIYRVSFASLNGIEIRGWLSVPARDGQFPGLLILPGYTQSLYPPRPFAADHGYCTLALSVRGHEGSRDIFNPGFPGLIVSGIESRETYTYRGIYADALRGFDVLSQHEKTDPKRIAVTGLSQGGALTLVVSSRRPVAAAAPDVPFLCGLRRAIFRSGIFPYDEIVDLLTARPDLSDQVLRVLDYFDVLGFAPDITCPVYMSVGQKDPTAPPEFAIEAFQLLRGERFVKTYPLAGHEGGGLPHQLLKMQWLKQRMHPPNAVV
jgi:cephalosporin-C deacetylase